MPEKVANVISIFQSGILINFKAGRCSLTRRIPISNVAQRFWPVGNELKFAHSRYTANRKRHLIVLANLVILSFVLLYLAADVACALLNVFVECYAKRHAEVTLLKLAFS